jgi:hypothetical protein
VTHLTATLKYDSHIEREEWKRTKRREGEGRGEEAKDVGKSSKPNNQEFPQRKDIASILID